MSKTYNLKNIYKYKDNDDKSEDLLSFLINTVGDKNAIE